VNCEFLWTVHIPFFIHKSNVSAESDANGEPFESRFENEFSPLKKKMKKSWSMVKM
jgi:hypothetical protein